MEKTASRLFILYIGLLVQSAWPTSDVCLKLVHQIAGSDRIDSFTRGRRFLLSDLSSIKQYLPYVLKVLSQSYSICTHCDPMSYHNPCSRIHLCAHDSFCYSGYMQNGSNISARSLHWRGCCKGSSSCGTPSNRQIYGTQQHVVTSFCKGMLCDYGSPSIRNRLVNEIHSATPQWTQWGRWGTCPVTCGAGVKTRHRMCIGRGCPGHDHVTTGCTNTLHTYCLNTGTTAVPAHWTEWNSWSQCSVSCGSGRRSRQRTCIGTGCSGQSSDVRTCHGLPVYHSHCYNAVVSGHGWETWGAWSVCQTASPSSVCHRSRRCLLLGIETHQAGVCPGEGQEATLCKDGHCSPDPGITLIEGQWTSWSSSACSVRCGQGTRHKTRLCHRPPLLSADQITTDMIYCRGSASVDERCHVYHCSDSGVWSDWTFWSCSVSCGHGVQTRTRQCARTTSSLTSSYVTCYGDATEKEPCDRTQCPQWGQWQPYSLCSVTCGNGTRTSYRYCHPHGSVCDGTNTRTHVCLTHKPCPENGNWGAWSHYGHCEVTCGRGFRTSTRKCDNPLPSNGGKDCLGPASKEIFCIKKDCPVDGGWSSWHTAHCSVTCGTGTQTRNRTCTNPAPSNGGADCMGVNMTTQTCQMRHCPVDGGWTKWSPFNGCSVTCGEGTHSRLRKCTNPYPSHGGNRCIGNTTETRACNRGGCPITGGWGIWSTYSPCSHTCGNGTKHRSRICDHPAPAFGGNHCSGQSNQTSACYVRACPVNGGWGTWSTYANCSKTCGGGIHSRTRTCSNPAPQHGGTQCHGASLETKSCSDKQCPIDGGWGTWVKSSSCSVTCGDGVTYRTRECTHPKPAYGGHDCFGNRTQQIPCRREECPVDGQWSSWSELTVCSKSCGGGVQQRKRNCSNPTPVHGGHYCPGNQTEVRQCNVQLCPVDGGWSMWSEYSACSRSCDGGRQHRHRNCSNPRPDNGGQDCQGNQREMKQCNVHLCPVDGGWSDWSVYSPCSVSCGGGHRQRGRNCSNPSPKYGGVDCSGKKTEIQTCNVQLCPVDGGWSEWSLYSICSVSCGAGEQKRQRNCSNPEPNHGGKDCLGNQREVKQCNVQLCPVDGGWSEWSVYSSCSVTCGSGRQHRDRKCSSPSPRDGGLDCSGKRTEFKTCNVQLCPVDGGWSEWSVFSICSHTCGGGRQQRIRNCSNPFPVHGGHYCLGNRTDSRQCNVQLCPVDGGWSTWSTYGSCSVTCGHGRQQRDRNCSNPLPAHGGKPCQGVSTENSTCTVQPCPTDGSWGPWTEYSRCTTTCGTGMQMRSRDCTSPAPANGGLDCAGPWKESKSCALDLCPVDGGWNEWSRYSDCSEICGKGVMFRNRSCTSPVPQHGGHTCLGETMENKTCNVVQCPVNGQWSQWTDYGQCSMTCGQGVKERTRTCDNPVPQNGGKSCSGEATEITTCTLANCSTTSTTVTTTTAAGQSLSCYNCVGPVELCEMNYSETTCHAPNNYCINDVTNNADGSRTIVRRCGSEDDCYTNWYLTYSDDDKCTSYDSNYVYTNQFQCSFCCTTPGCNLDFRPSMDSLYDP